MFLYLTSVGASVALALSSSDRKVPELLDLLQSVEAWARRRRS